LFHPQSFSVLQNYDSAHTEVVAAASEMWYGGDDMAANCQLCSCSSLNYSSTCPVDVPGDEVAWAAID
jgi:hypothetical protein